MLYYTLATGYKRIIDISARCFDVKKAEILYREVRKTSLRFGYSLFYCHYHKKPEIQREISVLMYNDVKNAKIYN